MTPLAAIRAALAISQPEMAKRLGVSLRALQYQEARARPSSVWLLAARHIAENSPGRPATAPPAPAAPIGVPIDAAAPRLTN